MKQRFSAPALWRVLATASLVVGFSLSVAFVVFVVAPWAWLTRRDDVERMKRVRGSTKAICVRFVRWGERLGVMRLRVEGESRLRGPRRLVVANHPCSLDAIALLSLMDDGLCVVRNEHWDRPVMRSLIAATGFVFTSERAGVVDACVERLEQGASVLLFPEGTRSPASGLHPLQRGAAHVALRRGCALLPVVMTCDPPAFRRDVSLYRPDDGPFELCIRVQEPIAVDETRRPGVPRPVAARQLTAALHELYEKSLEHVRA